MSRRRTAALCLFAAVLAGPTTRANAEVQFTIKEVTSIRPTHDGRYFGRASLQVLSNGVWVMTSIHSDHHWKCHDGQIEVMFSSDEGRTWAPPNTYLDGKPVSGPPTTDARGTSSVAVIARAIGIGPAILKRASNELVKPISWSSYEVVSRRNCHG